MIDWDRIKELRTEIGEEDFREVVEIFLEEVEDGISRLKSGVVGESLAADLHFLKGSALNLGFSSFSSLCQAGETAAVEGKGDQIDLTAIICCYEESKTVFKQGLST